MKQEYGIQKRFPGANSAYGFFSYYHYILWPTINRLFILKGGPGTGKSTLMKEIGQDLLREGFSVEYHYCSSNSHSLDGVAVPALGAGVIDGTAPHINDPVFPGVFEEIVDLGTAWDKSMLGKNREDIIQLGREKEHCFDRAYTFLSTAKQYLDAALKEQERIVSPRVNFLHGPTGKNREVATQIRHIVKELLPSTPGNGQGSARKLFISAITPQGPVNHLDNLVKSYSYIYVLSGEPGSLKRRIVKSVREAALHNGFAVEDFCCALDPYQIDHLGLPELDTVIINSKEPHLLLSDKARGGGKIIPIEIEGDLDDSRRKIIDRFTSYYREALQEAVAMLQEAGKIHDQIESYYIPAMDFSIVETLRHKVLQSILELTHSPVFDYRTASVFKGKHENS